MFSHTRLKSHETKMKIRSDKCSMFINCTSIAVQRESFGGNERYLPWSAWIHAEAVWAGYGLDR